MSTPNALVSTIIAIRPRLRSNTERIAFAVHAFMVAEGYKLEAVGENAEKASSAESVESSDHVADFDSWNSSADAYTFLYNPDLWQQGDLPACYQNLDELISKLQSTVHPVKQEQAAGSTQQKAESGSGPRSAPASTRQEPSPEYGAADDEFPQESTRTSQPPPGFLGSHDAVPPGFLPPGYGGRQQPFSGGRGRTGGMHMGPDDPLFAGSFGTQRPGRPGMNPAGARYDPIGPPGMPGFNPDDFQRGPGQLHPDLAQPGPGMGADWDTMFG